MQHNTITVYKINKKVIKSIIKSNQWKLIWVVKWSEKIGNVTQYNKVLVNFTLNEKLVSVKITDLIYCINNNVSSVNIYQWKFV